MFFFRFFFLFETRDELNASQVRHQLQRANYDIRAFFGKKPTNGSSYVRVIPLSRFGG